MGFADALLTFSEVDQQPYRDCVFSAGLVHGHPVDTIYLRFARAATEPTTIILRPDEAVRIAGLLCNAVWSEMLYPARHAVATPLTAAEFAQAMTDGALVLSKNTD